MEQPKCFFYAGNRTGGTLGHGRGGKTHCGSGKRYRRSFDPVCWDGNSSASKVRLFHVGHTDDHSVLCVPV